MPLGMEVGLGPGHIVLDRDPARPPTKKDSSPQLSAHVCCAQTAEWIKMQHDVEVGIDASDNVLHGDPDAPAKRGTAPNFRLNVYCGQTVAHLSYC